MISIKCVILTLRYHCYCFALAFQVRGDLTKSANFKDSLALRIAFNVSIYIYFGNWRPNFGSNRLSSYLTGPFRGSQIVYTNLISHVVGTLIESLRLVNDNCFIKKNVQCIVEMKKWYFILFIQYNVYFLLWFYIYRIYASCEIGPSVICGQCRSRSACKSVQSNLVIHMLPLAYVRKV